MKCLSYVIIRKSIVCLNFEINQHCVSRYNDFGKYKLVELRTRSKTRKGYSKVCKNGLQWKKTSLQVLAEMLDISEKADYLFGKDAL